MSTLDPHRAAEKVGVPTNEQPLDIAGEAAEWAEERPGERDGFHGGGASQSRGQHRNMYSDEGNTGAPSVFSETTAYTAAPEYHEEYEDSPEYPRKSFESEDATFLDANEDVDGASTYASTSRSRRKASGFDGDRHRRSRAHRNGTASGANAYDTYAQNNFGAYDDKTRTKNGVQIEIPRTAAQQANNNMVEQPDDQIRFDPSYSDAKHEDVDSFPAFFHHEVGQYGDFNIFSRIYLELRQFLAMNIALISLVFIVIFAYARYLNPMRKSPPKARTDLEYERRITGERLSERVEYYAEYWGYRCEEYEIVTKGGWILKAHRISDPRRGPKRGYPVVLQHGILCNSLFYFTAEERSLGFWLVDQGFDVWATNIRSNFGAGHTQYNRWDPRFWAWGVHELADDLVDVVDYVLDVTGFRQLAYVGHSQGTGSMFLALGTGYHPELGYKLSSFTALGPAVYPGKSLDRFPFRMMRMFSTRYLWSLVFGVRDFMAPLTIARMMLPAYYFGHIAYVIFGYLFDFTDHNWVNRQKPKIFRGTVVPTSSELLYFYMGSFVYRGCIFDPSIKTPWFPRSFPPLTVVYGTIDFLVVGKPLVERLLQYERNVEIVHILELQGYEHMDMVFGVDAFKVVFPKIKDTIVRTMDIEDAPVDML